MVTTPLNFSQRDYLDAISELAPAGQLESFNLICEESSNIIVNLVDSYNASGETLAHAAVLSNRFIAAKFDSFQSGQRSSTETAAGSFLIAMKLREVKHPSVLDLADITGQTSEQIRAAEEDIVVALDWNINITTGIFNVIFIHPIQN